MNRTQALTRLRKLYGNNAGIQHNPSGPTSPEERAAMREAHQRATEACKAAHAAREARAAALLASDPEYIRLRDEYATLSKAKSKLPSGNVLPYYVGTSGSFCFSVMAEGYTLREAVELAEAAKRNGTRGTAMPKA